VYVHHRWNGKETTDSAKVQAGKFSLQAKCVEPTLFWVTVSTDLKDPNSFSFFPDAGQSKLNLIGDSLPFSKAEAGINQADYLLYRVFINELVAIQAKLNQDYAVASQKGDMAAQQAVQMAYQELNARYVAGVKSFVKEHPASLVSAFVVYNDFTNPAIAIDEVEIALAALDPSLSQSNYYIAVQKKVEDRRGTTVGYKATNFSQAAPDGKIVKLSDFKGQYVLIDFWASWCRPCRMENPNVVAAYNKFKDKGFTVLGVSMDSNKEPWLQAIRQDNLTWTQVSDLKGWGNEVGKLYGVQGIPQNFLVDKDGKIIAKDLRGAALEEKLAEVLK
jgi:peroxiredoxin